MRATYDAINENLAPNRLPVQPRSQGFSFLKLQI